MKVQPNPTPEAKLCCEAQTLYFFVLLPYTVSQIHNCCLWLNLNTIFSTFSRHWLLQSTWLGTSHAGGCWLWVVLHILRCKQVMTTKYEQIGDESIITRLKHLCPRWHSRWSYKVGKQITNVKPNILCTFAADNLSANECSYQTTGINEL